MLDEGEDRIHKIRKIVRQAILVIPAGEQALEAFFILDGDEIGGFVVGILDEIRILGIQLFHPLLIHGVAGKKQVVAAEMVQQ